MNGEPLQHERGLPPLILIPRKYRMKQPKWLTEIELVDTAFTGYLGVRGGASLGNDIA
jgi:DMSO/TMAO reductase YedYZ molybdopterin-dependent catalytic subunit